MLLSYIQVHRARLLRADGAQACGDPCWKEAWAGLLLRSICPRLYLVSGMVFFLLEGRLPEKREQGGGGGGGGEEGETTQGTKRKIYQ